MSKSNLPLPEGTQRDIVERQHLDNLKPQPTSVTDSATTLSGKDWPKAKQNMKPKPSVVCKTCKGAGYLKTKRWKCHECGGHLEKVMNRSIIDRDRSSM